MTHLTLRLVPHHNAKVGFITWASAPKSIKFHDGGIVTLFCPDNKGVGPIFVAELLGIDPVYGWCAEIFVRDDHLRSLMDFVVKTNGTLIMEGVNADQVSDLESAWAGRVGYVWEARSTNDKNAMHIMVHKLGEAYGKGLSANKLPPDKFHQIRYASCQWTDVPPFEYVGYICTWVEAVSEGYGSNRPAGTSCPIALTIIDIEHKHESESDYETAVDLSHWSMVEQTGIFKTAAGLRIVVTERQEYVTHSYLEPDFDLIEAGGETVYHGHADRSNDRETQYRYMRFEMPRRLPELSVDDFAELDRAQGDYSAIDLSDALERYLGITEWGDAHSSMSVCIDDADIQPFLNAAEHLKFKKGRAVLVSISIEAAAQIRKAESKMLDICLANLVLKTHNSCEKARFDIHETTRVATIEICGRAD